MIIINQPEQHATVLCFFALALVLSEIRSLEQSKLREVISLWLLQQSYGFNRRHQKAPCSLSQYLFLSLLMYYTAELLSVMLEEGPLLCYRIVGLSLPCQCTWMFGVFLEVSHIHPQTHGALKFGSLWFSVFLQDDSSYCYDDPEITPPTISSSCLSPSESS